MLFKTYTQAHMHACVYTHTHTPAAPCCQSATAELCRCHCFTQFVSLAFPLQSSNYLETTQWVSRTDEKSRKCWIQNIWRCAHGFPTCSQWRSRSHASICLGDRFAFPKTRWLHLLLSWVRVQWIPFSPPNPLGEKKRRQLPLEPVTFPLNWSI